LNKFQDFYRCDPQSSIELVLADLPDFLAIAIKIIVGFSVLNWLPRLSMPVALWRK